MAATVALALAAGSAGAAAEAQDRLHLCRAGRRPRLELPARRRPQGHREGARRQGRDDLRRERAGGRFASAPSSTSPAPGTASSSRPPSASWSRPCKVARSYPNVKFEHATGIKRAAEPRHLRREIPRGPLHHRPDRGQDVEDRHHRLCRRLPDPGGRRRHQLLFPRRPVGEPERQDQGRLGELLVRPGQGGRCRESAARPGRRRARPAHRQPGPAADRGGARQDRLRPGLRHGALRPEGAAHRDHRRLGAAITSPAPRRRSTAAGSRATSGAGSIPGWS